MLTNLNGWCLFNVFVVGLCKVNSKKILKKTITIYLCFGKLIVFSCFPTCINYTEPAYKN